MFLPKGLCGCDRQFLNSGIFGSPVIELLFPRDPNKKIVQTLAWYRRALLERLLHLRRDLRPMILMCRAQFATSEEPYYFRLGRLRDLLKQRNCLFRLRLPDGNFASIQPTTEGSPRRLQKRRELG